MYFTGPGDHVNGDFVPILSCLSCFTSENLYLTGPGDHVNGGPRVFGAGALVQCSKLPVWKVENRGFKPHYGLQVSKKQNVSSPLTREDSILWGASVTEK